MANKLYPPGSLERSFELTDAVLLSAEGTLFGVEGDLPLD